MSLTSRETPREGVALIRITRPEVRNALNLEVRRELAAHFRAMEDDAAIRCVVIAGDETAFAAGADLKEMSDKSALDMYMMGSRKLWKAIGDCPLPVIAAVNGFALGGGCELAMHADIIIAGEGAQFGQPEIRVGIMPGGGGTQRLLRAVGKFKAMKLLLTGEIVTAAEAEKMGLVSEVVPDAEVLERALTMAGRIAKAPPVAVRQIKEVVSNGADAPLDAALWLERKAFELLFDTEDQKEGMAAFLEKRKPEYKGR
jgi:enoyl-CoA hydratase/carnithine racemase